VRATVLSVFRCAVPLLTVALWLVPSFLHPAVEHTSATEHAPAAGHASATEHAPAAGHASATEHASAAAYASDPAHRPPRPAEATLALPCPDLVSARHSVRAPGADSAGAAGDNCVAGLRGVSQGVVPAPVPPPALAELLPRDRPYDTDATRAPPDHAVRAPGLHQLQVLRT
jgi:hypothetical protein